MHTSKHASSIRHSRWKNTSNFTLTIEKGLSFLCGIWQFNLVYIFSEAWPAWWGAPALCCNLCVGGGQKWLINQALKMHFVASTNLLVTFFSPHSCTKASVVFIAGTAIRIMRPKGLSISQKAWLGKNKLHLSPWRGPDTGRGHNQQFSVQPPLST